MVKKEVLSECVNCGKLFMARYSDKARFKDGRAPRVLVVALKLADKDPLAVTATCNKCSKKMSMQQRMLANMKELMRC